MAKKARAKMMHGISHIALWCFSYVRKDSAEPAAVNAVAKK
jgi:hypothetical protein